MNWCSTCATPLPSDWEVCPGCELYGAAIEALDDAELFESYKGLSTENVRLYKENQALRREAVAVGLRRDPGLRTHDPKVPRAVF